MNSMKTAGTVLLLTTLLAIGHAQTARAAEGKADEADPASKVQKMNRYAMQLFDDRNFALAEKTLLDALAIVEKSNLGSGPAGLATNGNLAVLYSLGLKNPDKAVFHFKKALAIKP
ncbi:MAG TPA: tetratricopeptide repeat protein, partial [Polyangia bacterium]